MRLRNVEQGWNAELSGRRRAQQGDLPEERGFAVRVSLEAERHEQPARDLAHSVMLLSDARF